MVLGHIVAWNSPVTSWLDSSECNSLKFCRLIEFFPTCKIANEPSPWKKWTWRWISYQDVVIFPWAMWVYQRVNHSNQIWFAWCCFLCFKSTSGSVHPVMVSWQRNVNMAHLPGMSCCYLGSMDYTLGIQVCPKKGINPTILLWGWDWDHQTYSREGYGCLGITPI